MVKVGLGQDSHRIEENNSKPLLLGGVLFEEDYSLKGNSDADVILHALTNAISGVSGHPVLGAIADEMCKRGLTDSALYVAKSLEFLREMKYSISHVSCSVECKKPKIVDKIPEIKKRISEILDLEISDVAVTATTGEGLTEFGRGNGIQAFVIVTTQKNQK